MALLEKVSIFCFAASYGVALALELAHLFSPRPVLRYVGLGFGAAGLLAQFIYLLVQPLSLASPAGSLLFLALILVIFYMYGTLHHYRLAWGLFVLPLILALIGLAVVQPNTPSESGWTNVWVIGHVALLLLAAVGVCVGFIASVMYLVQMQRLRAKAPPGQGMKLMSLERLEAMNRRAILWSFPLLTAGLLVGVALQVQQDNFLRDWDSPKILSSLGLWLVFAILLYLRYGVHVRGRQVALLTMVAFAVLLCMLVSSAHPFLPGGTP
jgi:ABC-type uncharacterized transport system permease subunit